MRGQIETKHTPLMQAVRRQMQVDLCGQYSHLNPAPCNKQKNSTGNSPNQTLGGFLAALSPPIEKAARGDEGISVVLPRVQVVLMQILPALLLTV